TNPRRLNKQAAKRKNLPQTRRIGVLWNPATPSHSRALPAVETAGEKLALELRLCRDVQVNLAYRWFWGLSIEVRSVITVRSRAHAMSGFVTVTFSAVSSSVL